MVIDISKLSVYSRVMCLSAVLCALILASGCGGSSSTNPGPGPGPGPTPTTATQIRIGDAPADRVIAFELSIGSPIVLTPAGGGAAVNVTVGQNRIELSHMSGKFEPLGVLNVPQGSYSSAAITITNPEMTFLDNSGVQHTIEGSATQTVTVSFSPALTIGASAGVLSVDVNIANSVAVDGAGNITGFNFSGTSFTFSNKVVAAENAQEDEDGELEDITGMVTSVSGSSFTLKAGQSGAQLTFTTDSTTEFNDGVTDVNSTLHQIVKVEGVTKSDGTLFAKEVEGIENENGAELEGLITKVTGSPATSLDVVAQDGIGSGMDDTKVGASFTADVSGAQYKVDAGNIDTSGLGGIPGAPNFPLDATSVKEGQRVEVESAGSVPAANGTITAEKVKLQQQALTGTVSNFTAGSNGAATFDLNLASDGSSYLTLLSGQILVHVFQQPGTDNKFGAISNSSQVRVRGLLFWTGTSFNMIARRITNP